MATANYVLIDGVPYSPKHPKVKALYEDKLDCLPPGAVIEQVVRDGSLDPQTREARHAARISVRVTSIRQKLTDPDNLCPKYFVDCLRYSGLIPDDSPQHITLTVAQRETNAGEKEHTIIEVTDEGLT